MPDEGKGAPAPEQPEQWLAQGEAVRSGNLAKRMASEPAIQEIRRLAPDLAVLLATPKHVAALRAEFPDSLVLEPDTVLKPPG